MVATEKSTVLAWDPLTLVWGMTSAAVFHCTMSLLPKTLTLGEGILFSNVSV